MFGMAHRDGSLSRVHKVLLAVLAVAALAGGAVWTRLYVPTLDIDEVPLAAALISAGVVIPLLSATPGMRWLDKIPVLRGLLGLVTGRALTIYLLYPVAVAAAPLVIARLGVRADARTLILATVGLTVLGVLLFGWVEDLAARRPLGIYPRYRRKKRKSKSFDTRAVPLGAPVLAVSEPVPVPQQAGPRQPVLQGAGPAPALQASGPHRAVGGWSNGRPGAGPRPPVQQQVGPGARPPAGPPPHRTGPPHAGPQHPGLLHSGPQSDLPYAGPRPGMQHSGPQPDLPHPGLLHSGPQPPLHPGPLPPRPPQRGAPPPPNGGPARPGQHSGEQPPPQFGPPPAGPRPPGRNGGPPQGTPQPSPQHPDPHPPPPPQRRQPPPPPAQRSGRPR